ERAGVSLASCARLLSENSTEFSLRSPRSFEPAADEAAADDEAAAGLLPNRSPPSSSSCLPRALLELAENRSPGSLFAVPLSSLPPPNMLATAAAPPPPPPADAVAPPAVSDANAST